jgi:hypothetical protein
MTRTTPGLLLAALVLSVMLLPAPAQATNWRLMCAILGGDLTEPGEVAAFRRCLTTHDPRGEMIRQNFPRRGGRIDNPLAGLVPGSGVPLTGDAAAAPPPRGFGRNTRKAVAQAITRFQTLDGKVMYIIATDGRLWRSTLGSNDARALDHGVAAFRLTRDGHLYELTSSGDLWRENADGSGRALVDQAVGDFAALDGRIVYVRGTDGRLWRETGDMHNRTVVDGPAAAFQPVDGTVVFVLGTDHRLWRETGDLHNRKLVASAVAAFQYLPDGDTTYVLTAGRQLWRENGAAKAELVDSNVAGFHAVDMHLAYVLATDGQLWRELGNRAQAVAVDHGLMVGLGSDAFQALDASHVLLIDRQNRLWAETMPSGR